MVDPLVEQQRLQASDAAASDQFGHTVSLSGDTAIVGAYLDDNSGGIDAGAAYVFSRISGVWTQQQKLTASAAAANDFFGFSVSVDGDTAVIGSLQANSNGGQNAGAVYVFTRSGGVWTQQQRLQASDVALNDFFGYSVSVSGDTAVISSVADDNGGDGAGSAYVFVRSGGVWTQQQWFQASDAKAGANFGHSVSLEGDTVIISAWQDNNSGGTAAGAAYVFARNSGVWTQQQKLTASDATVHNFFGVSVSLSGSSAIVGAYINDGAGQDAGAAYVFTRTGGAWTQQQKLTASDAAANDYFGHSVSVSGDMAVVNSIADDNSGGIDAGSVYIFTRSGGVWAQQQKLTASDAAAGDLFGFSVSLSGDRVLVGAAEDNNNGGADAGSAYLFVPETVNAAPVVNAGPDQSATEDVAFNLTSSFTDADASDTHTATVNWGDSSPNQTATMTEPSASAPGTVSASHTYHSPGNYTATVTVTDGANASGSDSLQMAVSPPVSANYIQNTTIQQPNANFNISGSGIVEGNLSINGALNAHGSWLTDLNAANITTGTLDNSRLGAIPTANISDGAVTSLKIADFAVTAAKIGTNQVVKKLNGLTEEVNLAAGENLTITPSGNTLIFSAAGGNFIQNTTTQQPGSNFNISGNGAAANLNASGILSGNIVNAATQFNIGGSRVLSIAGTRNIFVGDGTGRVNTTGFQNSFAGTYSGFSNTEGSLNSFVGYASGYLNTTGNYNSFFGTYAGYNNTTGYSNSYFGINAGVFSTESTFNSYFGTSAGTSTTTGSSNSIFGAAAGHSNTTGYNNSFFGYGAGYSNTTGFNNTIIGINANVGANNLSYATAIGAEAIVSASNTVVLGRSAGQDTVLVPGKLQLNSLGSAGGTPLCRNAFSQIANCSSSLRYKTNVVPFSFGLSLVRRLRPIQFVWKDDGVKDLGFAAEEVAAVEPLLVIYNDKGDVEGVKYDRISAVLVNAVKEQQTQIETQQRRLKEQQTQIETQQRQIKQQQSLLDGLKKLLCFQSPTADVCQ
jgi:hypothetical protein